MTPDTDELHAMIFTAARVAQQATVHAMAEAVEAACRTITSLEGSLQSSLQANIANLTALDVELACTALTSAALAAQEATAHALAEAVEAAAVASTDFDSEPRAFLEARSQARAAIFSDGQSTQQNACGATARARTNSEIGFPTSLQARTAIFISNQVTRESRVQAMTAAAEAAATASFEKQLGRLGIAGPCLRADSEG